ncbi:MAG TPA: hypothetical protein VEA69_23555 [Tepidisphaeraceae bacterium]|nr:hypothetical protein [Tepidisphaeraceae bacterium]
MRDYGKIIPAFWTGETGKSLRACRDTQVVALYLCTSPHANMIGLYYLPVPYLCHEVGCTPQGALKALRSLSEGGFAHYDEGTETVWVVQMARIQVGDTLATKDNRWKAMVKVLHGVSKSPHLPGFIEMYRDAFNLHDFKPLQSPSEAPSKPLRSQKQEQDQKQEQEQDAPAGPTDEEIYQAYPKHTAKADALKAIAKAVKIVTRREGMTDPRAWLLARVRTYAAARTAAYAADPGEKKYTPDPATWFNRGRYDDDDGEWTAPPPKPRNGDPAPLAPAGKSITAPVLHGD